MARTAATKEAGAELNILELATQTIEVCVLGQSPLVFHRMAAKAQRELLMPRGRMSAADKNVNLKHDPITEYRDSMYQHKADDHPTRLYFPASAFKQACATAALRIPGATKTEIGQLVWMDGWNVNIYGVPQLRAAVVRMADIKKTPDIRFTGVVPAWACMVKLHYVSPQLSANTMGNLLAAAGLIAGIGDGRQEKGKLSFGQFRLVSEKDPVFQRIIATGFRAAQDAAIQDPAFFDDETGELVDWYNIEIVKRRDRPAAKLKVA